jgi:wyosine [tRNA(Phe)-imidazoG37] synthetase (radical SAM superfamily)
MRSSTISDFGVKLFWCYRIYKPEGKFRCTHQQLVSLLKTSFMAGFLFHDIVFGPVRSRRFGVSLGINLLPLNTKVCSFNCIYCECGLTPECPEPGSGGFYSREAIRHAMETRFAELVTKGVQPDNITFAGNGEPTLHPEFDLIIDDTIALRNRFFPGSKITVLSNATTLSDSQIKGALLKVDNNVLKLDAGTDEYLRLINDPLGKISLAEVVSNLKHFNGNLIIQSLFLRGNINGKYFDSGSADHVKAWLEQIREIAPKLVMIYPIDRATPVAGLEKLTPTELDRIAEQITAIGIETEVYY